MRSILLLIALACFIPSFAQQDWIAQNGPYGGEVQDIEYDAASGWTYAIIGSRLYYSEDLGGTWTQSTLFFGGVDIEIANGTVYFLAGFDLYTSPAGEDNFTDVNASGLNSSRRLRVMPNGTLVTTAFNGAGILYFSTNGGVNWSSNFNGAESFVPEMLEVTSDNKVLVLYATSNTVKVLSAVTTIGTYSTFGSALANVHSIATSNDGATVYAVTSSSFFEVAAAGGTWTTIEGGDAAATTVSNTTHRSFLEFSADGSDMFFIDNHNHELHHKTVGGLSTTWVKNNTGFPGTNRIIRNASALDGSQLFLGTNTDVFKVVGTGYGQSNGTMTEVTPVKFGEFGSTLYLQGGSVVFNEGSSGVYTSFTNGNTWEGESRIPNPVTSFTYASDFASQATDHVLALVPLPDGVSSDLYRRVGSNWNVVGTAPEFEWVELAEDAQAIGFEFGLTTHPLHYSSDGGATWGLINVTGLPTDYDLDPEKTHLSQSQRMLTYVFDMNLGISSWYRIDINPFSTPMTATATNITSTLPFANIDKALADNNRFYFVDNSLSTDKYAFSSDGITWTTKNMPFSGSSEFFVADNGYIFIVNRFGADMYMSRNNGTSYIQTDLIDISISQSIADVFLDHEGYALFAVYQDLVYKSRKVVVVPDAPTNLTPGAITKNTIALYWLDFAYNEEYHLIERSIDGVNFTEVAKLYADEICESPYSAAFYVDQNLDPATAYTYRISTVNDAGASAYLQDVFTTLADCSDETIPDGRSWSAANTGGTGYVATTMSDIGIRHISGNIYEVQNMTMSLTGSPLVGKFTLDCDKTIVLPDANGEVKPIAAGVWNSLASTITLRWMECGNLNNYETVTFTLNPPDTDPAPDAPVVQALVKSDTEVAISWTTGFNQKDFVVERATTSPAGPFSQIGAGSIVNYPGDSFVDPGPFTIGVPYYYRVTARNNNSVPETAEGTAELVFAKPNFIIPATEVSELVSISYPVVWGDFDGDGLDDVMTQATSGQTLEYFIFKNLGNGDFSKQIITLGANKAYILFSAIDFNNDGKLDLGAAEASGTEVDLYQGNGDFTFIKLSAGLVGALATDVDGEINSVTWSDVDRDGDIDALVIAEDPNNFSIIPPQLFLRGASGAYAKVSGGDLQNHPSSANFAIWTDYDGDALIDVLIVDGDLCILYKGTGGGNFTAQPSSGITDGGASAAWGDYDADGLMDLFICSLSENALYRNNGSGFTRDVSTSVSTDGNVTLAPLWLDINNDGLLDLITPGYFSEFFGAGGIYMNTSSGGTTSFSRISTELMSDTKTTAFGGASADYDKDGFVDVCLSRIVLSLTSGFAPSNFTLFQNNNTTGNWIEVKLQGTSSNRQGVGAKVFVETAGKGIYREMQVMSGVRSQNSNNLHFGIGTETAITKITVFWPSGITQVYNNPPINTPITIIEDNTGPLVTALSPDIDATGISVSTTAEITFDEIPVVVAGKNIYITRVSDATVVRTESVTTGVRTGNKFTFTFTGQLDRMTEYEVSFDAGAFTDLYGNGFTGLGSPWTFNTRDEPAVTVLVPADALTGVAPNTTLSVTFDVATTPVAAKQLKLYLSSDLVTPVLTKNATTSVLSSGAHVFTLPSALLTSTNYTAIIEQGAFTSTTAGPSPVVQWSFTTAPGPSLSTLSPTNGASLVALDATLQVTFSAATTPVASKEINVYILGDEVNPVITFQADDGSVSGNTHTFTPLTPLIAGTSYIVHIDAGAFVDGQGGTYAGTSNWQFSTVSPPQVSGRLPSIGALSVALNTQIGITFDMAATPVAGKFIDVFLGSFSGTLIEHIDVTTESPSGNQHLFALSSLLQPGQTYTIVLDAGAFQTTSNGPTSATLWQFETAPAPTTTVNPADGATDVAPNTDVEITGSEATTPVAGKKLSVYLASDLVNPLQSLNVTAAVPSGNKYTFDLTGVLPTSTQITAILDAGAFVSTLSASTLAKQWSFTTAEGPGLINPNPADIATDVPPNIASISITADVGTAVPGKMIRLFKSSNLITPVHSADVSSVSPSGNTYTYAVPSVLETAIGYTVIIEAAAFVDAQGGTSATKQWSFTTAPGPSLTNPVPSDGQIDVAPNIPNLKITAATGTAVSGKMIRLFKTADLVNPVHSADVSSVSPSATVYTYPLSSVLLTGTSYTVVIEAGAFVDSQGGTSALKQWSFTTIGSPAVTARTPAIDATNVSVNTPISITFAVAVTKVPGNLVQIFESGDLVNPVMTIDVASATSSGLQRSVALTSSLQPATLYTVMVETGAFVTAQGAESPSLQWEFETVAAPALVVVSPVDNAINVLANTSLAVTFDVATTANVGQLKVYKTADLVTPEFAINASSASPNGNEQTFTLPSFLDGATAYTVQLDAGAFKNAGGATTAAVEWHFTTKAGPQVTTRTPGSNATNVAPNTGISVTFDVATTRTSGKQLKVFKTSDLVNPLVIIDVTTAGVSGNQYTFTLDDKLETLAGYTVTIDAGAFQDGQGGSSSALQWAFTTSAPPAATTFVPANGATTAAPNTIISVTFAVQTTPVAGQLKVFKSSDLVTHEFAVSVTSSPTGTMHSYTLPGDLETAQAYTVKIDAGAFENTGGAVSAELQWSFTTKGGPQVTTTTPTNNATGVASNTSVAITFNAPTTPVSGKAVNIYLTSDMVNPIRTLSATDAVPSGNKQTLVVTPNLPTETSVTVIADAGAFRDAGHAISSSVQWSFTTMPGPKVIQLAPLDEATNVNANTTLEITFDQSVTPEAGKMIRLFKQGNANPVFEAAVTSGLIGLSKATFDITPNLQPQTSYTVIVEAAAFRDATGNLSAAIGSTEWNFVSAVGATASGFLPTQGATNVSTNAAIEITFDKTLVSAVSGKRIKVLNGAVAVVDQEVSTGTITGSKYKLNAPAEQWPAGVQLTVAIDAGALLDAGGNESFALTAGTYFFTTEVGPQITVYQPIAGEIDVPTNTALELTFDKSITAVGGKVIRVMNGATQVFSHDVSINGTVNGTKYSHPAPAGGWPIDKLLTVTLDAGAFRDSGSKPSPAISGSEWTFRVVNIVDTDAPAITFEQVPLTDNNALLTSLSANISDNVGVSTATLSIRPIGGSSFTQVSGTPSGSTYTFTIAAASFDAIGAEYFFTATDGSDNSDREPATGYHHTYLRYTGTKSVPSGFVGTGGTVKSWKVISVPFELGNNNAVSSVFSELTSGLEYKVDWRMLVLSQGTNPDWIDYGDERFLNISRGKGYMINIKNPSNNTLTIGDNMQAPANDRSNLFSLSLKAGWNLIGNPYLTPIDWGNVVVYNHLEGTTAEVFKQFNNGYDDLDLLEAYRGGFVQVDNDITVTIPFQGQTASGGRTKDIVFKEGDWLLPITLGNGDVVNTFGGVGMHHQSVKAFDRLDNFNGPHFMDVLEMNFEHPDHFPKKFSRDVVPVQDEYMWEFNVDANTGGIAEMTWDPAVALPAGTELYLWDQSSQLVINMSEAGSYQFEAEQTRKFRIYFGKDARNKIRSDRSLLGEPYPNPSSGISYIPYYLPEGNPQYGVKIEVFDMMGRKVGVLTDGNYPPGVYKANWNANDANTSGLYSVRMTVVTGEAQDVYSTKILLTK